MVADDEAVNDEAAEGHGLRRRGDFKGVFDGFKGGHDVSIGASATDTSQKSRSGNGSLAPNGLSIEAFVFSDFKVALSDLTGFNFKIKAGRTFDFRDIFKREIEINLMHEG